MSETDPTQPLRVRARPPGWGAAEGVKVEYGKIVLQGIAAALKGVRGDFDEATDNLAAMGEAVGWERDGKPETLAWRLVATSLAKAVLTLLKDYQTAHGPDPTALTLDDEAQAEQVAATVDKVVLETEIWVDLRLIEDPANFIALDDIAGLLEDYLYFAGLPSGPINVLGERLPAAFAEAFHQERGEGGDKYQPLDDALIQYQAEGDRHRSAWRQYYAWLKRQPHKQIFNDSVSLNTVYIEPRSYYVTKDPDEGAETGKLRRHVGMLHDELRTWIQEASPTDCIRLVSGGPGSGKSSAATMLAAELAGDGGVGRSVRVVLVRLHGFLLKNESLAESLTKYLKPTPSLPLLSSGALGLDPIGQRAGTRRLVLILDGLDEVRESGEGGYKAANDIVDAVLDATDGQNSSDHPAADLQVLILGRTLATQNLLNGKLHKFRVHYLLGYGDVRKEIDDKKETWDDPRNRLTVQDQLGDWWKNYSTAVDSVPAGLPKDLERDDLDEILREPLLVYLLCKAYRGNPERFSDQFSLNDIYNELFESIYTRFKDVRGRQKQHIPSNDAFQRVWEMAAIAAWHTGTGRGVPIEGIASRLTYFDAELCDEMPGILGLSENGTSDVDIARMMLAFYVRATTAEDGRPNLGAIEFTHRSFGEYFTARRLLRTFRELCASSDNLEQKLETWCALTAPVRLEDSDEGFLKREMTILVGRMSVEDREVLIREGAALFSHQLRTGMPVHHIDWTVVGIPVAQIADKDGSTKDDRIPFAVMRRRAAHAEGALALMLTVLSDAVDGVHLPVDWPDERGTLSAFQARMVDGDRSFYRLMRSGEMTGALGIRKSLDLTEQVTGGEDTSARVVNGSAPPRRLEPGIFLRGANLIDANLIGANLIGADLRGANLRRAKNLRDAIFTPEVREALGLPPATPDNPESDEVGDNSAP